MHKYFNEDVTGEWYICIDCEAADAVGLFAGSGEPGLHLCKACFERGKVEDIANGVEPLVEVVS